MATQTKRRTSASIIELHERVASLEAIVKTIPDDIAELKAALNRYKGAWGALLLIGSAVTAFLTIFWTWISKKLGWAA